MAIIDVTRIGDQVRRFIEVPDMSSKPDPTISRDAELHLPYPGNLFAYDTQPRPLSSSPLLFNHTTDYLIPIPPEELRKLVYPFDTTKHPSLNTSRFEHKRLIRCDIS